VTVTGLAAKPRVRFLRGFSAPVQVSYPRPADELAFLVGHDSDGFARWDALQTLVVDEVRRLMNHGATPGADLVALFGTLADHALEAEDGEPRFMLAAMLTLADETYLIQQFDAVDVASLCDARDALRVAIAQAHRDRWQAIYQANGSPGPFDPAAGPMSRRSLKHAALEYLAAAMPGPDAQALLDAHYRRADNLTDRQAALRQVTRHPELDADFRQVLLDDFYQRWQAEALVVDVWLSLQASSPLSDAGQAHALTGHPAFDARNPNKLRAVYGAFSRQNHRRFHELDGSGYRFLGDSVLEVDGRNPSMAASLAMPLTRWRRFDAPRARLMRSELERLAGAGSLSRDLYEVVSKSLV
jgi:aminopeptidase N